MSIVESSQFGAHRDRVTTCMVLVPDYPADDPSSGRHPCRFLADDVVRHVAKAFDYKVEVTEALGVPPANFSKDLDRLMAVDLLVADLTGCSGEICFQVGLRYMTARPLVCCVNGDAPLPPSLAHVRPIRYSQNDLRGCEAELIRRLNRIHQSASIEGRPFFEVQPAPHRKVLIGGYEISAAVLADIEDRLHQPAETTRRGGELGKGRGGVNGAARPWW